MLRWSPTRTRHARYCIMYLFTKVIVCSMLFADKFTVPSLPVLVLPTTVVCMELQMGLSKVVGLEEVMDHTDDCVCPLSSLCSFVNEVVDLHR